MYGDYVNGIDLNTAYDMFDTDPGTGCAVWYDADGNVDWDGFTASYEAQLSLENDATSLAAETELLKNAGLQATSLEMMTAVGCAGATFTILLMGLAFQIKKNRVELVEEEDDYERI